MLLSSKSSCRALKRPSPLLALVAALALIASAASIPSSLRAEDPPSPAAADDAAKNKEGSFMVQVPQSPPLTPIKIGYLRETPERPRPASRLDVEPKDAGVAGAKMAIEENNAGGRFTGHDYSLDVSTVSSAEKAVEALQKFLDSGHNYIVVDASADTLLKLSDWARARTFFSSIFARPTYRCGRRTAAPMSCMSRPTVTCLPMRSPSISSR